VAIGWSLHDGVRGDTATPARPVLDNDVLSEDRADRLRDNARDGVDRAAGAEPDHDAGRALRKIRAHDAWRGKKRGAGRGETGEAPPRHPAHDQRAPLSSMMLTPRWRSVR